MANSDVAITVSSSPTRSQETAPARHRDADVRRPSGTTAADPPEPVCGFPFSSPATKRPRRSDADLPEPVYEFPGCRPVHISRDAIADYDGRIEYWDAATETAMVCEPTTIYHEHPSQRLAQMAALIAVTRGAPIETCGTADLLLRDEHGARRRILQADQSVYLHPDRDRPTGPAMVVGEDALPDVVVEVDHTTDVRRGKLALYESWGLREVWVEVPEAPAPGRPGSRKPGLTIHLLGPDGYRVSGESRAFPGWTAAEIYRAMNEPTLSAATVAVLERVGRTLRDREGRRSKESPFLRRMRGKSRAAGHAQGRAEGRAQGRAEGRALLCRQAALRFDAGTAERLAKLLAGVDDSKRLADVGDWIVGCATGAELLDRVLRLRDRRPSNRSLSS